MWRWKILVIAALSACAMPSDEEWSDFDVELIGSSDGEPEPGVQAGRVVFKSCGQHYAIATTPRTSIVASGTSGPHELE